LRNVFDCKKVAIGILVGIVESSEYYCTFEQKRLKNYRKGNFNNLKKTIVPSGLPIFSKITIFALSVFKDLIINKLSKDISE
jgi:hypothetical protein